MSFSRKLDRRRRWLKVTLLLGAVAIFAVVVLAGCGSSSSSSSTESGAAESEEAATEEAATEEGGTEEASEEEEGSESSGATTVSEAELQTTVNTALETEEIKASSLPPLMKETLELATAEPSEEEMETAFECWKANSCTIGEGPITLGLADGFGDNTWRQFSKMGVILQAMKFPEVGKIILTNAHGELATFQSNLRSLTAQGAKAIVVYNDFGPAAYSALEAAQREGAAISTYVGPNDGAPVTAINTRVQPDICQAGKEMAKATEEAIGGKGPVAYFEGTPGNPEDEGWKKCASEEGIESIFEGETEWTPAGAQKAASALVASGKPVKAILYSYSNPVPSIVNVYLKAGKEIPAIVTWTQNNETTCQWIEHPYKLYQTNALNWAARVSVDAVVKKTEGEEVPEAVIYPQPFSPAKKSSCEKGKPAEYPGKSALIPEFLTEKMLAGQ
jgi:ABC-type sugar transport system substrate-binding protein